MPDAHDISLSYRDTASPLSQAAMRALNVTVVGITPDVCIVEKRPHASSHLPTRARPAITVLYATASAVKPLDSICRSTLQMRQRRHGVTFGGSAHDHMCDRTHCRVHHFATLDSGDKAAEARSLIAVMFTKKRSTIVTTR